MSPLNIFPFLIAERNLELKIMPTANRKKTKLPKEAIKKIQRQLKEKGIIIFDDIY